MNLPNKLSLLRICMIPVFAAVFYLQVIPYNYVIAAVIFALAAATDFLDGYIARKYNLVTNLGKFLDPIADKVLVSTALILLLTIQTVLSPLWAIAVAVILARELIVSGFRTVAASRNLVLAADKIGKVKTFFQDVAIITLLVGAEDFFIEYSLSPIVLAGQILLGIAVILTIISGVNYIVKNRQVLKEEK